MLILGLLGMYFDAVEVFVTKSSLFFRLAVAILWRVLYFRMNFWLSYDAFKVVFFRSGHLVHDSQFLQWSMLMSVKLYLCKNTRILNRDLDRNLNSRGLDVTYCIFLSFVLYLHILGR